LEGPLRAKKQKKEDKCSKLIIYSQGDFFVFSDLTVMCDPLVFGEDF